MPASRIIAAPRITTLPTTPYRYKTKAPEVKPAISDRLREVERAAVREEILNTRCCGKCKTPYNCGNTGCTCHSQARLVALAN